MSHTPRPKIFPSRTRPPNGSTVHPSPAGTTSIWPLRWTTGPAPPRREPTTFTRGCRAVCSARPSAAMYSTANAAALEVIAEEARAGVVLLSRRVDGGNPDQIRGELDDLVGGAIDFGKDALDGLHG